MVVLCGLYLTVLSELAVLWGLVVLCCLVARHELVLLNVVAVLSGLVVLLVQVLLASVWINNELKQPSKNVNSSLISFHITWASARLRAKTLFLTLGHWTPTDRWSCVYSSSLHLRIPFSTSALSIKRSSLWTNRRLFKVSERFCMDWSRVVLACGCFTKINED